MKTLIAGSRNIKDEETVINYIEAAVEDGFDITEVVSGTAEGVDTIAEEWAEENDIPVSRFPYEDFTDDSNQKPAPLTRNDAMIDYAEQAIVIWNGQSSGTEYVIEEIKQKDVDMFLRRTDSTTLSDF